MGKGFFESDEHYRSRISEEANERIIEDSTGSGPTKGFFESDEHYRSRISEEANERIIEDSTGSAPTNGFFESDEHYRSRISEEANERVIEDSAGSAPTKGFFESDEHYRSRISEEANERIIDGATGSSPARGFFETGGHYRHRIRLEALEQRAEGTTAPRRVSGSDHYTYEGGYVTSSDHDRHGRSLAWLWMLPILILVWAIWNGLPTELEPSTTRDFTQSRRKIEPGSGLIPTKFVKSDPGTGLVTIEATADGFGTSNPGWFTVITGGTDQQTFLLRGFPDLRIGNRLRITYDPSVPESLQGPVGTAAHMSGVIVSMKVIGFSDR